MNERNNFTGSKKFILMSVLLPVFTAGAVIYGLYLSSGLDYSSIISRLGFVLCYDFIFLFYIGTSKRIREPELAVCLVATVIPAVGFLILYLGSSLNMFPITAVVLFGMVTLLCAIIDFSSGLILLAAIACYTFLFVPVVTTSIINTLLFLFLACILVNAYSDTASLIVSVIISILFYAIVCLMSCGFIMEEAFTTENIVTCLVSNTLLVGIYFVKRVCAVPEEDEEQPLLLADIGKRAGQKDKSSKKSQNNPPVEPVRESSKAARQEISRLKEELRKKTYEYDKLKSKHDSVVASTEEFDLRLKDVDSEISRLKDENNALDRALTDVKNNTTASFEDLVSPEFEFINSFRRDSNKLYRHSQNIASISREAAGLIGCDEDFAYILGLYHEAPRFLGENYRNELLDTYHVPRYIIRIIDRIKDKNNNLPLPREAGIVMLTDDIISTSNYLKSKQNETVPLDRIVTNTIKVRKDQNVLRLAGFSNEEIQLLKLYYIESGGNNDTAD